MTQNQIRYAELEEAKRHNRAVEAETERYNRAAIDANYYAASAAHKQAAVVEAMLPYNQWNLKSQIAKNTAEQARAVEQGLLYQKQASNVEAQTTRTTMENEYYEKQRFWDALALPKKYATAQAEAEKAKKESEAFWWNFGFDTFTKVTKGFENIAKGLSSLKG